MLPPSARLISADDHMIEPRHLWVDRIPAKFRDDCPRIVEKDGREAWLYEGELTYMPMGSCRAAPGFGEAGYPPAPGTARYDEIRPGCYDPVERIKDMDIDGVWGQLIFPNGNSVCFVDQNVCRLKQRVAQKPISIDVLAALF